MTIETARQLRELARAYHALGFNLVPLGDDKRPVVTMVADSGKPLRFQWEPWQTQRQTARHLADILRPAWWAEAGGLAAICGPVSGGLVCIDFDRTGEELPQEAIRRLGGEPLRRWLVRTPGGGWHLWLRAPELAPTLSKLDRPAGAGHVELRHASHMTALPGSRHPSGGLYAFLPPFEPHAAPEEPPPLVDASALLAVFDILTEPQAAAPAPRAVRPVPSSGSPYALAALENEADAVRHAQSNRNDRLNVAAFSLGQLVGAGLLDESETFSALEAAALACGLEEREVGPTIRSGLSKGKLEPRQVEPRPAEARRGRPNGDNGYSSGFAADGPTAAPWAAESGKDDGAEGAEPPAFSAWPYAEEAGRLVYRTERRSRGQEEPEVVSVPIADFTARIVAEELHEDGRKVFRLEGRGLRGGRWTAEIPADAFGEDRRLKSVLSAAAGALDGVAEGMGGHLGPAIKKLSDPASIQRHIRYERTGWSEHGFLLPGMEPTDVRLSLYRKLPYSAGKAEDLPAGLEALASLLRSLRPEITSVFVTALLQAPANGPLGWHGNRYALFLRGRTGSFKTSFAQAAFCLFGAGFSDGGNLLKWGEGATRNALLALAGQAHDLPFLIDNFKPQTGGGSRDFINVIHNILEGGERERLSREAALRRAAELRCLPVATGEDVPDDDAASLARVLVLTATGGTGATNAPLAAAQRAPAALAAVGTAWIGWLSSDEGMAALEDVRQHFEECRQRWSERLGLARAVNANRLGATLAQNELAFGLLLRHPHIGPVFAPLAAAHRRGLEEVAGASAAETAGALEAERWIAALRELYVAGKILLPARLGNGEPAPSERDRIVGFRDEEGIYLLPKLALRAARELLGSGSLALSASTISRQLVELGFVARLGDGENIARKVYAGGRLERLLHLHADIFERTLGADEPTPGGGEASLEEPTNADLRALGL